MKITQILYGLYDVAGRHGTVVACPERYRDAPPYPDGSAPVWVLLDGAETVASFHQDEVARA